MYCYVYRIVRQVMADQTAAVRARPEYDCALIEQTSQYYDRQAVDSSMLSAADALLEVKRLAGSSSNDASASPGPDPSVINPSASASASASARASASASGASQ